MKPQEDALAYISTDILKAESIARRSLELSPHSVTTNFNLAYVLSQQGRYQESLQYLKNALYYDPKNIDLLFNIAYTYSQLGELQNARLHYGKAFEFDPHNNINTGLLYAQSLHALGDNGAAKKVYLSLAQAQPNHPLTAYLYGRCLLEESDHEGALKQLQIAHTAIQTHPEWARPFVHFISRYDSPIWNQLDNKVEFAKIVGQSETSLKATYFPKTFVLPDDYESILQYELKQSTAPYWILKAAGFAGGQQTRVVSTIKDEDVQQPFIAQSYITNPYLLDKKKFNIRLYLVLLSFKPLTACLWSDGIVFVAPEPFTLEPSSLGNTAVHVANILRAQAIAKQPLTDDPVEDGVGQLCRFSDVLKVIESRGSSSQKAISNVHQLAHSVVDLIRHLLNSLSSHPDLDHYAWPAKLLGLDILLDEHLNPHLLEIERYPGLEGYYSIPRNINSQFKIYLSKLLTHIECQRPSQEYINSIENDDGSRWFWITHS